MADIAGPGPVTALAGVDLAWTGHKPSGICVLRGSDTGAVWLEALECEMAAPEAIADRLAGLGEPVIAAIDAPLVRRGDCTAERELGRVFGRYRASAYTASLDFLARKGLLAGPALGDALRGRGFTLDPADLAAGPPRVAFEVYPHALHVVAFALPERLLYKKGTLAVRRAGMVRYQQHLREWLAGRLPAVRADPRIAAVLDPEAVHAGGGRGLKALEDRLDAVTCALAAWEAWRNGLAAVEVFGDAATGSIAVPGLARDPRLVAPSTGRC